MSDVIRDRYELLEIAGEGGEGTVVRSLDRQHERVVALKIRTATTAERQSDLLAEARVLLAVPPHRNLALVREDFFDGDRYVIAMDWIEGSDLGALLRTEGRPGLPVPSVLRWLADAASALTHLHTQDPPVVHGDVKPANLILSEEGRLVLVDFGLSSTPRAGRGPGGTPGYVAPERTAGEPPSRATDVYGLAATAWALLTGAPPTGVRPHWDGLDPAVAEQLEAAIRSGLATDPARRPATVGELVERIRAGWGSTLPTGVLTFCMTDIVGSTERWHADPIAMAKALVRHDDLVASAVQAHGGRVLKSMGEGDATVSVFEGATAAVEAARDIQRALAAHSWEAAPIEVRIGLHTGEADRRGDDYFGAALSIAARLRGEARAGEVLLSDGTAEVVRSALPRGWGLVDLGAHRLRGVDALVPVWALSAPGVTTPPPTTTCPYRGLLAFQAEDRERFVGRESVVADLVERLGGGGLVAVVGSSGSGKSSLLRAGVAPAFPRAVVRTPADLGRDPIDPRALLVVDQLEELFTILAGADRERVVEAVLAHRGPTAVALRADFYGHCAEHPELAAAIAASQVLLGPMRADELARAIREPAATAGLEVEPALVDLLVEEVAGEPGALPLLSHALQETWRHRDGRRLTLQAYRETGGVRGAIAATADQLVASLTPPDQRLARSILLRLVEPGTEMADTRRRARLNELRPHDVAASRVDAVLAALADARLVTVGESTAEISHEALIREWPQLGAWLDEDREGLRIRRHLATAAAAWDDLGRERGELYRGPRLTVALDWLQRATDVSALERAFLEASEADAAREIADERRTASRLRRLLAGVAVALVGAIVAAVVAAVSADRAAEERDRADLAALTAESRRVGTEALAVDDIDTSLLLAMEGVALQASPASTSNLLAALGRSPRAIRVVGGDGSRFIRMHLSPDGSTLYAGDNGGTLHEIDTETYEIESRPWGGASVTVSPDGRLLVRDVSDAGATRVELFDLEADKAIGSVPVAGYPAGVAVAPDGASLAVVVESDEAGGNLLEVWDLADLAAPVGRVPLQDGLLGSVAFSPDGARVLATGLGETVVVDRATVTVQRRITGTYLPMAVSPDGTTIAAATEDEGSAVGLFDLATGERVVVLNGHRASVLTLGFDSTGRRLASSGDDTDVVVWDVASGGRLLDLQGHAGKVLGVQFSPDGRTLYSGGLDSRIIVWDLAGDRGLAPRLTAPIASAIPAPAQPSPSPDGTRAILGPQPFAGHDEVQILDLTSGEIAAPLATGHGGVSSWAWVDGGTTFVTGGSDGVVRRWSVGSDSVGASYNAGAPVTAIAASADTGRVVVGDHQGTITELDARSMTPSGSPVALDGTVWSLGIDPRATTAVVVVEPDGGAMSRAVVVVDLATGTASAPVSVTEATSVAVAPDASRAAVGHFDGTVTHLDLEPLRVVGRAVPAHDGFVLSLDYTDDSGTLLSTGTDGRVAFWDAASRARTGSLGPGQANIAVRGAFGPDGHTAVLVYEDGSSFELDSDVAGWMAHACSVVARSFSEAEWAERFPGRAYRATCD